MRIFSLTIAIAAVYLVGPFSTLPRQVREDVVGGAVCDVGVKTGPTNNVCKHHLGGYQHAFCTALGFTKWDPAVECNHVNTEEKLVTYNCDDYGGVLGIVCEDSATPAFPNDIVDTNCQDRIVECPD